MLITLRSLRSVRVPNGDSQSDEGGFHTRQVSPRSSTRPRGLERFDLTGGAAEDLERCRGT